MNSKVGGSDGEKVPDAFIDAFGGSSQVQNTGSMALNSMHEPVPNTVFYRNQASITEAVPQVNVYCRPPNRIDRIDRPDQNRMICPRSRETATTMSGLLLGGGEDGKDGVDERDTHTASMGHSQSDGGNPGEIVVDMPPNVIKPKGYQFGMWEGVFIRCLLNIWGVMMFLRMSWVVGEAGVGLGSVVVLLSVFVTTITTVSLSAICTNGEIKAGGAYYMISRSLGPEFGGSIGLAFYCANTISVALYLIGFAEAMGILMGENSLITPAWDLRIFALLAMLFLAVVAFAGGANLEVKAQKVLLMVMLGALASFFIGGFITDGSQTSPDGITGLSRRTLADNVLPDFSSGESFLTAFGVFFPAVTGIMAGANISGDLKNPQTAIPNGTFLAIGLSTVSYILLAVVLGATVTRDVLKDFEESIVTVEISLWKPIVYAGIFAATLSSALAQIIGAPRVLMALARDDVFPFLAPFGKGYGKKDEPVNGYLITFAVAAVAILAGDLNSVSPIITNFFLVSYALVNYACFASTMAKSPGWRPTFKYYNPWVALFGGILCFGVMLMVDLIAAGITVVVCFLLYKYVDFKKPNVNWGSAGEAYRYVAAVNAMYKLEKGKNHIKNFRPQYLVMVKDPRRSEHLLRFAAQLNEGRGGMVAGQVIIGKFEDCVAEYNATRTETYLIELGIQAFLDAVVAPTFLLGCEALLQLGGMGRLRPNTVFLGYKNGWEKLPDTDIEEYVNVIRASFGTGNGVGILRGVDEVGTKIENGTIDLWWLVDDGGLTILVAHLLSRQANWRRCKIRLFTLAGKASITSEQVRMQRLLRKFRIVAELVVVDRDPTQPYEPTQSAHLNFKEKSGGGAITHRDRSAYFVQLSALLHKHSKEATLLVVTLPVPRYNMEPRQYMTYLGLLSDNLPPTVLLRGNQESVITFYS